MELTGKIGKMSLDYTTGKAEVTFVFNEKQTAMQMYDKFHNKEKLSLNVDEYSEIRSLEANRYLWVLCGKLAEKLSGEKVKYTKEEIYRNAIKESGVWCDDEVEPDKVKWRCAAWRELGLGWFTERVDFTPDGEKEIIRFYYGSSRYNKRLMSKLIDNIVQDCQAAGIETKTPDQIAQMLSLWKGESKR